MGGGPSLHKAVTKFASGIVGSCTAFLNGILVDAAKGEAVMKLVQPVIAACDAASAVPIDNRAALSRGLTQVMSLMFVMFAMFVTCSLWRVALDVCVSDVVSPWGCCRWCTPFLTLYSWQSLVAGVCCDVAVRISGDVNRSWQSVMGGIS